MKKYFILSFIFFFLGCRPIKTTQEYYQEYISPKPSIAYEDIDFDNIPIDFLDNYYEIDSKIVRIANQIQLVDNFNFQSQADNPDTIWIKYFALFDADQIFISGDDVIGFDPIVRGLIDESPDASSILKIESDRLFWIYTVTRDNSENKYLVFEIDQSALLSFKKSDSFFLVFDSFILENQNVFDPETLTKIQKSKKYSGSYRTSKQRVYWTRSMAADNLYYLFNN